MQEETAPRRRGNPLMVHDNDLKAGSSRRMKRIAAVLGTRH